MARYSAAFRSAGAGSATLPLGSLYATASIGTAAIVECGVFNTTATAVNVGLVRLSTAGTQGSAITVAAEDDTTQSAICTPKNTHTVGPTLGGVLRVADLGASIGSGVIWTFGTGRHSGLLIPSGTANGIGVYVPNGTGQVCDIYFVWDE